MKLVRYGSPGQERPGLMDENGTLRDLSGEVPDIDLRHLPPGGLDALKKLDAAALPAVEGKPRLGPPVAGVHNVLGIGLNYRDHAQETGIPLPAEPVLFNKHTGSLAGPDDPVALPLHSRRTDWEVELVVVVGDRLHNADENTAADAIAGYMVGNDLTERGYQTERGGQWVKGKSLPGYAPVGPWFVTADQVPDPQNLRLWLTLNDRPMQDSTTAHMVVPPARLVSYVSTFCPLEPGDLLFTGTPAGVGMGQRPQRFLEPGDVLHVGIDGLGEQRQAMKRGG